MSNCLYTLRTLKKYAFNKHVYMKTVVFKVHVAPLTSSGQTLKSRLLLTTAAAEKLIGN